MKHIFFIDPIEKLNIKKDSTMLFAITAQEKGHECYFLFEKDFYLTNHDSLEFDCYEYEGELKEDFYVKKMEIKAIKKVAIDSNTTLHMRIDPPYDSRYQRYLWMLNFIQEKGVNVVNNPIGIMKHNEKLEAYKRKNSLDSYVGNSLSGAKKFVDSLIAKGETEIILKPLDLYQGIGVEKVSAHNFEEKFLKKTVEFQGPVVIQKFEKLVSQGEARAIFYQAQEIGSILKTPVEGEFLANIAQGASFKKYQLSSELMSECREICLNLMKDGVDLVAFDLLAGKISEVNVTCPGLVVEVSHAYNKNILVDTKMF